MNKAASTLLMVRHGQSQWNLENKFTGWVDVPLSDQGRREAQKAGRQIKELGLTFDLAYTSVLIRAINTLEIILKELGQSDLMVIQDKALNERMYGDLQGLNKDQTREKYGKEQVHIWRRSFDVPPPGGESLKDTAERTLPYFESKMMPDLKSGKNLIVAAHGNSLRSIVMKLDNLTGEEVAGLEIPTGVPLVYTFDSEGTVLSKKSL
jgi:2,3-bisphosphoglycerate-dependent phosphoglycerate mutase